MKQITHSYEETQQHGESLAKQLSGGDIVLLFGDLGAGKTTFMQGLAKGLGIERRIISPTFIIVRKYEVIPHVILGRSEETAPESKETGSEQAPAMVSSSARMIKRLYHIDLYRTETETDLKGIGLPEIFSDTEAVVAIEWPERLSRLPEKRWEVHLKWLSENEREIEIRKFI